MLKKTIQFKDENQQPAEVDAYFNLTKAECLELNIRNDLNVVGRSKDMNEMMDAFKRIMSMAYGVKTSDGKFLKVNAYGAPVFNEFSSSEAYSVLFLELFSDQAIAETFIKAILPAEFSAGEGEQTNQADIPGNLAKHPSMQGYNGKAPTTRREALHKDTTVAEEGPEYDEYQAYLKWKAEKEAPSEVVSSPEVPQEVTPPTRDELS